MPSPALGRPFLDGPLKGFSARYFDLRKFGLDQKHAFDELSRRNAARSRNALPSGDNLAEVEKLDPDLKPTIDVAEDGNRYRFAPFFKKSTRVGMWFEGSGQSSGVGIDARGHGRKLAAAHLCVGDRQFPFMALAGKGS